jgi:hypothetical protein
MTDEKYVVVTTIGTFRQRYCIPMSELQSLNIDTPLNTANAIEWAEDSVTAEDVKEFSQHWLGENIVDTFILDEERVLNLFDRDNDYLKDWTKEEKIAYINKWKEGTDG